MKRPTLSQIEKKLGPAESWAGRCFEIATACVDHGFVKGRAVYGHWRGEVAKGSYFDTVGRSGLPFVRHGWVLLEDGSVFDPTRWAFTGEKPFLFFGASGQEYDEGGNKWRRALQAPCPEWSEVEESHYASKYDVSSKAWARIERLLGESAGPKPGYLTVPQVRWLANVPFADLQPYAREIYAWIAKVLKTKCIVPIDNWRAAFPEEEKKRRK